MLEELKKGKILIANKDDIRNRTLCDALKRQGIEYKTFTSLLNVKQSLRDNRFLLMFFHVSALSLNSLERVETEMKNIFDYAGYLPEYRIAVSDGSDYQGYAEKSTIEIGDKKERCFQSVHAWDFFAPYKEEFVPGLVKCIREIEKIGPLIQIIYEIPNTLLPLHISLQAFFGISRDEKGARKKLPEDLPEEVKKEYGELFSEENRQKAFLLVKEAEWDFYAELGYRLISDEKPMDNYGDWSLLNLLNKLLTLLEEDTGIKKIIEDTKKLVDDGSLKSICAILTNIDEGTEINPKSNKTSPQIKTHIDKIIKAKKFFEEENQGRAKHTKWPVDVDGEGITPDESYKNLVNQLSEWNKDWEKAETVIDVIEKLSANLQQVIKLVEIGEK